MEFVLASSSARREQLLSQGGFDFRVVNPGQVEDQICCSEKSAVHQARILALAKAQAVAAKQGQAIILGADTVVAVNNQVIGKAGDRDHAKQILSMLSGSRHEVITGLALLEAPAGRSVVAHEITSLQMAELSDQQIEHYLDTGPWQGKAGAYAIQEDDAFITSVEGSFSNVVGLPMELLERMLSDFVPAELLRKFRP